MYCIGLMSGTSVDGIDAALVEIMGTDVDLQVKLLAGSTFLYPPKLREQILAACEGTSLSIAELAELDDAIACQFALAAQKIQTGNVRAQLIGSHGQTAFHRPPFGERGRGGEGECGETGRGGDGETGRRGDKGNKEQGKDKQQTTNNKQQTTIGYSLQLGRGEVIAHLTCIPTVSNFRGADIAAGGQGAPLVSKVDAYLLSHPTQYRCIQNIGGIANVTYLPARQQVNWEEKICGWDTGPGNALLDLAVQRLTDGRQTYDKDGSWAAKGIPCERLVNQWLEQDFFQQPPPKSTGRELFGEAYVDRCWEDAQIHQLSAADWLATLTELTVASIVCSYRTFLPQMPDEVLLCGGGSRNLYLKQRLQAKLATDSEVLTTDDAGVCGDFKEAIAFAVLAYLRFSCSLPGNLPQVTGAKQPMLLGDIHLPIA